MTPDQIAKLPYRRGVGVMLANAKGKVFAGQRIDTDAAAWQMPQGGIDAGEDARQAALRELWEETGVSGDQVEILAESAGWITYDVPEELVPRIWHGRYRGQKQRWFLMRFLGADDQIHIDTDHAEFSKWCWIDPRELASTIVPFKRQLYAAVVREFADLL